jgi:NAD(P)H-nitrite reductase large subunit
VGCGLVPSLVLVMGGVRPDTSLAVSAGPKIGAKAAIAVGCGMRTWLPDV